MGASASFPLEPFFPSPFTACDAPVGAAALDVVGAKSEVAAPLPIAQVGAPDAGVAADADALPVAASAPGFFCVCLFSPSPLGMAHRCHLVQPQALDLQAAFLRPVRALSLEQLQAARKLHNSYCCYLLLTFKLPTHYFFEK